jgi:molecular chaperone DnaK
MWAMSGQMPYQVGVDLGTAYSAAAVCRPGRGARPEIVPLESDAAFMPSVVFLNPDGTLLVGADALDRMPPDPGRLARQFTRRIGDGTPLWLGGTAMTADEVAARFVADLLDVVAARVGGPPSGVALTHPAGWGPHRLMSLRAALAAHGVGNVLFLPEPQAAALAYADGKHGRPAGGKHGRPAGDEQLAPGSAIAVYDLGAGSFDAAVVRMTGPGSFVLLGRPEEIELGYLDFDEAVFEHVRSALGPAAAQLDALDPADPAVLAAVARLRRGCVAAKEALSADTNVSIPVDLPGISTQVRLTRSEFEEMIRPAVAETVDVLMRALGSAGLATGDLAAVLMVGGSARIPLVTQEVSARLGRPVSTPADPKGILAIGAALAASDREGEPAPDGLWPALPTARMAVVASPAGQSSAGPPPPPPSVPLPPVNGTSSPKRRRAVTVAAAALAAVVIAGGVALASRIGPGGAGAETTTPVTTTQQAPAGETGELVQPTVEPTTRPPGGPARQQQPNPPPATKNPSSAKTTTPTSPPPQTTTSGATTTGNPPPSVAPTSASAGDAGDAGDAGEASDAGEAEPPGPTTSAGA